MIVPTEKIERISARISTVFFDENLTTLEAGLILKGLLSHLKTMRRVTGNRRNFREMTRDFYFLTRNDDNDEKSK